MAQPVITSTSSFNSETPPAEIVFPPGNLSQLLEKLRSLSPEQLNALNISLEDEGQAIYFLWV